MHSVRENNVVFCPFTVDQGHLDYLTLGGGKYRVDLAIDGAANANIDHSSFGDAGPKRIADVRNVSDRRSLSVASSAVVGVGAVCAIWLGAAAVGDEVAAR